VQGNRDEEAAGCRAGRRIIYFASSTSPRARWRCCAGRRLGSGRFGARGRGGRCAHWIYGRTLDRAFLGSPAVRFADTNPACNTSEPPSTRNSRTRKTGACDSGASCRASKFAADCQKFRNSCGWKSCAARSGIRIKALTLNRRRFQKNILPRRANHRHIDILARTVEPVASESGRGLFD
jgi:hypothetical protein